MDAEEMRQLRGWKSWEELAADNATLRTRLSQAQAALREALRIASDENGEVFGGDLAERDAAIVRWKQHATAILSGQSAESVVVPLEYLNGVERIRADIESVSRLMAEAGFKEQHTMMHRWHRGLFELRALMGKQEG